MGRSSAAIAHLSNVDPVMRKLLEALGPCTLTPRVGCSPFESLVRAIAYQQLHDKAAASILKRLIVLVPGRRFSLWRAADRARRNGAAPLIHG